ncbi:maltose alpha-D-glucosyltransferase [Nitrosospira sp. Is2]|uniref:maltose alpha-D-glucosyltransferase n=1 Tax=Nitrosospira sp. Is2 TaxID=3080532 RepID=UPI002952EE0D|nr:maltose alpha-D-glucosyltransferase [Nitrosospira sp. Is2]WON73814.1 maltose alpha-D-glucosyltransferase [Nitrosospira sp. Is2]
MQQEDSLWYKDAIIYQLHVKTFFDSNGDGIGDFAGLISKLDYLQELGVTALWLLPFYPSPGRDDGYDIADYHNVHPAVGDMADFHRFINEAHRRGLRVITELVINHTSDQHPWFQAARRAPPGSLKRDYYVWSNDNKKYSGARSIFTDTEGSNWQWDEEAQAYYWHRFFYHQPDLNFENPHVFNAIMHVMRFWLDAGVDGMRLDAMPYLCEREGTNCENLPETHAVIKRMRAELDAHYPDRVFLAEANQWPEDVREYFGEGDECHMAFHFPLMPRMYMAIAREDRHPIVEIMEQTPDIPENCQWAIFLRNHDELTLEMVTDRERDYLHQTYAVDPLARLHLGIRRRLAPLLENDRHRIELMNLLLVTMPGSPILYYGDEIGMGDNLQLGDRNGVRTPMQWLGGVNGGFSTADPESLFLPPIVDPVYGFAAVNVERQRHNAYSLLNWTKRVIAVRKAHRTFGRGTLRFLRPGNRKILAYLREYEGETILCVANLSRAPQAVELDLSQYKGRVPAELMGRSAFPPIGALPYQLTLSGHGFYAFRLATDVTAPVWHEEPQVLPDLAVLVLVESGWGTLAGNHAESGPRNQLMVERARVQLEREILPRFFSSQPWFASRPDVEKFELGETHEWVTEHGSWLLAIVILTLASGETYRYAMPLALAWEDEGESRLIPLLPAILAKVRSRARMGVMFDAFWDDAFCRTVISNMETGASFAFERGQVRFHATSAFPGVVEEGGATNITRTVSERGRLLVNLGDRLILKGYRWLLAGVHPELEMSRFLTETANFTHIAQLAGTVEYVDAEGQCSTLAILEQYAENQGSAWVYTHDYLARYLDDYRTRQKRPIDARHAVYTTLAKTLGLRTAEFHQALAQPDPAGAFGMEPITLDDTAEWVNSMRAQMDQMYTLLEAEWPLLSEAARAAGRDLFAARPRFYRRIMRTAAAGTVAMKARCHGDYNLRQVWLSNNDFLITNYGGGPERAWRERRWKHTPLRDVAGILVSFSEVAAAALAHVTTEYPESGPICQEQTDNWNALTTGAFLKSYRRAMKEHSLLPSNPATVDALVTLFMVEKAAASLSNALSQPSRTVEMPIRQLLGLMRRKR